MQVQQVLSNLRQQSSALLKAQESVDSAIKVLLSALPNGEAGPVGHGKKRKGGKRPMSAAARKKISDAAKARWAAKKAAGK